VRGLQFENQRKQKTADVKPKYNHRLSLKPNILSKVLFLLFRSTAGCGNNHKTHKKNIPEHPRTPNKTRQIKEYQTTNTLV
jgi:hypothetical protein